MTKKYKPKLKGYSNDNSIDNWDTSYPFDYKKETDAAFQNWDDVSGIEFLRVPDQRPFGLGQNHVYTDGMDGDKMWYDYGE